MNKNADVRSTQQERAKMMIPKLQRIARRIARNLPHRIEVEDLVGAGMVGLAEALERMSDQADGPFLGYALCRARGEMFSYLQVMDPLTREQRRRVRAASCAEDLAKRMQGTLPPPADVARAAGLSETEYLEARVLREREMARSLEAIHSLVPAPMDHHAEDIDADRRLERVRGAVAALPPRLRRSLDWFDGEMSLREMGKELGVSESRVCQLRKLAVARLRRELGERAA